MQVEKFTNSLQKVVCPSCQSSHYFGATQDIKDALEPTIEKMMVQNTTIPSLDPKFEQRTIDQEIFWRCGVCESSYHFNLQRVTSHGIKVTCNTCFNFFILQKVGIMVDMDHMIMHEVTPEKMDQSAQVPNAQDHGILPPMIEESEVSGKFDLASLTERKKAMEEATAAQISASPDFTVLEPEPTGVGMAIPPTSPIITKAKTNPAVNVPPAPIPSAPAAKKKEFVTTPGAKLPSTPLQVKAADVALVDSFKSYHSKKRDFKIDKKYEISSVTFIEPNAQRKKKSFMEENMVKISVWISGISVFCLIVVFAYDWYESKHQKPVAPVIQQDVAPTDTSKPKYVFPDMTEDEAPAEPTK